MSDGTLGTPVLISLGEAARRTGLSKSTLSRKIRNGEISVRERGPDGVFRIDPSELLRFADAARVQRAETRSAEVDETARTAGGTLATQLAVESAARELAEARLADIKALTETQIADLRNLVEDLRRDREDLRTDRDRWRSLAERLALPAPAPVPAVQQHQRLWRWWRRAG